MNPRIEVSIDRKRMAAHIARARQRFERAKRLNQPRMNLSMDEMEALFSALQLGRLLAVERKERGDTLFSAFWRWLTKPRGEVGKLRDFTLGSGERLLTEPPPEPRRTRSPALTTES